MNAKGTAPTKMTDVARLAGVSQSTVSRALSGAKGVSEAERDRIQQLAASLGYTVSPDASRLARGETRRIAVVVRETETWFYYSILGAIEPTLRAAGLDLLFYRLKSEDERDRFFDELPVRKQVDGVILVGMPLTGPQVQRVANLNVPVVLAGSKLAPFPSVTVDEAAAARQAVRHLLGLGHTRIARIGITDPEGRPWQPEQGRAIGYRQELEAAGIPFDKELEALEPFSVMGGATAMDRLLQVQDPPTAVFAFSDEIAVAALQRSLAVHGVRVPDQMSVIGFDDHPVAELMGLTTIRQPVHQIGETAAAMLVGMLQQDPDGGRDIVLPTSLILRSSTRAIGLGAAAFVVSAPLRGR